MTRLFDRTFWGLTIGLVALFALNFLLEEWMRTIGLQTLSRCLVAIGLLILWRAGLVSFGHALFFGFGAYTVAMLQIVGVKDIFFLHGLPRAGNTVFSSIMNQNPNVAATANSICADMMGELFMLKHTDIFKNFPDHKSFDNVAKFENVKSLNEKNLTNDLIKIIG